MTAEAVSGRPFPESEAARQRAAPPSEESSCQLVPESVKGWSLPFGEGGQAEDEGPCGVAGDQIQAEESSRGSNPMGHESD